MLHTHRQAGSRTLTHTDKYVHTHTHRLVALLVFLFLFTFLVKKKSFYHTMGNLYPLPAFSILFSTAVTAFGTLMINVI